MDSLQSFVVNVEEYVREHLSHYIEELRVLCSIDSDSYTKTGLDEVARYLAVRMRALGMEAMAVEHEQWGSDVFAVAHGEGKHVVTVIGHIDTVYPVGTAQARPLRIAGDTLYGPGVCDMKGCVLAAVYALEAMVALQRRTFGELRFLCVSDEEICERHSVELMRQACEGSQGVLVLEAARANGDIVSARKGNANYTLTARGRAAHAGVEPEKGRNAIVELSHQILQFYSLNGWREGVTINPGVISGGTVANAVPDFAQARFDLRYLHDEDREATEVRWRAMLRQPRIQGVELTLSRDQDYKSPLVATPASLHMVQQAQEIAGMLGFSLNAALTGGASDASYASQFGIPAIDGLGPIGGRDHSPDEYLLLSSVAARAALLAGLISVVGE
jgi:glutamate carboxypeptidase